MKSVAVLMLATLVALGIVLVIVFGLGEASPTAARDDSAPHERIASLETRVSELTERLRVLERGSSELSRVSPSRADAGAAADASEHAPAGDTRRALDHDARWYLDQYVASFASGGEGSEYFRLAVDAYVAELVEPIDALTRDSARPLALRMALVRMFGKRGLRADTRVPESLLAVLRERPPRSLGLAALAAFRVVADASLVARLEALVWSWSDDDALCNAALETLFELASGHVNATIVRLLGTCRYERWICVLIARLDGADLESALAAFDLAQRLQQPVRLAAAHKIGEFPTPPFVEFVERWLQVETDEQVIAVLRGAREAQRNVADWSAMQMVGPPDADPSRDDRHAWASAQPDMGLQWIELAYANPDRARAVRVHEVNAPGALSELRACDESGAWHSLWTGASPASHSGPFQISFSTTSYRIRALRLVLDTDRIAGWNEIDAVELVGLGGSQWASGASASSTYAAGRANVSFR